MSFIAGANSANFNSCAIWNGQNGNVTTVGSNGGPSYYGTFDQSGNVFEWNDLDGTPSNARGLRGGFWYNNASSVSSSNRGAVDPSNEDFIGFRLARSSSSLNPLNLPYFVSVGDLNNSNDSSGYGAVNYVYQIGQYLVTNCEYAVFLNAVASTDSYSLYDTSMGSDARGGITRSGTSGSFSYTVKANMGNKPVIYVSWFDCARYCNWLHNRVNDPNSTETETGAYTLVNGQISGNAPAKNSDAKYHIPTENEWYKAAYYSPNKNGPGNPGYWSYATQYDTAPTCVTANSVGNGPISSDYSCDSQSISPTPTSTVTATNTLTPSVTPTNTVTPSVTPTNTVTPSVTPTNTTTPTNTLTPFLSPSPTPTNTSTPTVTPTNTITPTNTLTRTPTVTPSRTPRPTKIPGAIYIKCCAVIVSPTPTSTVTPTNSVTVSVTPTNSVTQPTV